MTNEPGTTPDAHMQNADGRNADGCAADGSDPDGRNTDRRDVDHLDQCGSLIPQSEPQVIDTRGLQCPLPVIRLAAAARSAGPGALLTVWATDPAARLDIPAWARMRGHAVVGEAPLCEVPLGEAPPREPLAGEPSEAADDEAAHSQAAEALNNAETAYAITVRLAARG